MVVIADLNNAQLQAVCTPPNSVLKILAGPGSGKTKVLTYRVCFLLHKGIPPENIILTTFTNKAAKEMKDRIGKLMGNGVENQLITGTFHSICRRYLARYGSFISLPKGFGIADADDTKAILTTIVKDLNLGISAYQALNVISAQKSNGISAEQAFKNLNSRQKVLPVDGKQTMTLDMARVYKTYEEKLKSMNLLDFDDLLVRMTTLLQFHPHVIKNIEHVLIDEFQDTNTIQYGLMRLFAQKCRAISIVGDPDQGIYGWRSANIGNLAEMRQDYRDCMVVSLEQNYRSSTWILKASMSVIEQDSTRFAKTLVSTKSNGSQPVLRTLVNVHVEGRWIAREIKRVIGLSGGLIKERDIAILVRSATITRPIEGGLGGAGIRYRMVGGHKFFDREEVKDILAYLRVVYSLKDVPALQRIINVPPRRIGKERIATLLKIAEAKNRTLWDSCQAMITGEIKFDQAAAKSMEVFVACVTQARRKLASKEIVEVSDVIDHIRDSLGYDDYLRKKFGVEADERIVNLEELKTFAKEVDKVTEENVLPEIGVLDETIDEESPLARFLGNIALMTDVRDDADDKSDSITISTIHAAKGLEWPVVFVPCVYQGSIPHFRADDVPEERRLLYVAMTRAQCLLYLSYPSKNSKDGKVRPSAFLMEDPVKPSDFITEPKVSKLLATRGTAIDVKGIASILNRPEPSKSDIARTSANLPSIIDEDWVESTMAQVDGYGYEGMRQYRPQTAVIGFTSTQISRNTTVSGLGGLNQNRGLQGSHPPTGPPMGFMTSREALAVLPPEQLTQGPEGKKRKSGAAELPDLKNKSWRPKQETTSSGFVSPDVYLNTAGLPGFATKTVSSGIVQDRGKPLAKTPVLPQTHLSSSPYHGLDVDALPSVSFSSPKSALPAEEVRANDLTTSPLVSNGQPQVLDLAKAPGRGRRGRPRKIEVFGEGWSFKYP